MTSDHASLEQDAMSADPLGGREGGGGRPSEFTPAGADGDDPITRTLKRAFDAVAAEPIPDDILQLLAALDDEAEGAGHD
ncbi:MAG: NepR family anti-sigma factor [Hyphomonadaceae bacterium]|nr:NepR family anti-sigma factor [Hyphomonadaceae bacterium]